MVVSHAGKRLSDFFNDLCSTAGLENRTRIVWEQESNTESVRNASRSDWLKLLAIDTVTARSTPNIDSLHKFRFCDPDDVYRFARKSERDAIILDVQC